MESLIGWKKGAEGEEVEGYSRGTGQICGEQGLGGGGGGEDT